MRSISEYNEYGLYNVNDIINDFSELFNTSLINLKIQLLSTNKKTISKEDVINYCINNFSNLDESKYKNNIDNDIINSRQQDYDIFKSIANIYKKKGLTILDLLVYLKENKLNKKYEKLLKELDINHYKCIICGRDAIRMLTALDNIINKYVEIINIINNLNTYNNKNYDLFAISSDKIYPNRSLVNNDNNYDNTSLTLTKKRNIH